MKTQTKVGVSFRERGGVGQRVAGTLDPSPSLISRDQTPDAHVPPDQYCFYWKVSVNRLTGAF